MIKGRYCICYVPSKVPSSKTKQARTERKNKGIFPNFLLNDTRLFPRLPLNSLVQQRPKAPPLSLPLDRFEHCSPLVAEQGSLCSYGMDSTLSSPEALTSSSDDDEYLDELTRQMAYHTFLELDDEKDKKPDSVPSVRTSKGCEVEYWIPLVLLLLDRIHKSFPVNKLV